MYQQLLENLGLSPNEAKIYEALVEYGEIGVSEIATRANIHRRNAYDAIRRLVSKGLCFEIFSQKENLYNAVDPEKLLELAKEKEREIERALPDLAKKFSHRAASEEAYIYRGLEGQKNIWRDVIRVGKDSYFIGAKVAWFDPRLKSARDAFFKEANRKNIRFIQLFDHEAALKIPDFPKHFPGKLDYRILPKEYSTNSGLHIFGDYVITHTGLNEIGKMGDNVVFFVLHSADLADSYRTWFRYMWEQSEKKRMKSIS